MEDFICCMKLQAIQSKSLEFKLFRNVKQNNYIGPYKILLQKKLPSSFTLLNLSYLSKNKNKKAYPTTYTPGLEVYISVIF